MIRYSILSLVLSFAACATEEPVPSPTVGHIGKPGDADTASCLDRCRAALDLCDAVLTADDKAMLAQCAETCPAELEDTCR